MAMAAVRPSIVFIGFGEAGMAFADGLAVPAAAYDRKTASDATRQAKLADYVRCDVRGAPDNAAAIAEAPLILSLVNADGALAAARETARGIAPDTLYCDMNSVASHTKRAAADVITAAGGRYVDVAIMAPVDPQRRRVPLLLSGPAAQDAADALAAAGFADMRIAGPTVGDAAAIKLIRSVMIKGLEALTTECVLAADRAGVLEAVLASLDASWPGTDWAAKADYNLDRMMVHGLRRADEMEEAVAMLDLLGTGSAMSRGTVARQRAIGRLGLDARQPLSGKLATLRGHREGAAA